MDQQSKGNSKNKKKQLVSKDIGTNNGQIKKRKASDVKETNTKKAKVDKQSKSNEKSKTPDVHIPKKETPKRQDEDLPRGGAYEIPEPRAQTYKSIDLPFLSKEKPKQQQKPKKKKKKKSTQKEETATVENASDNESGSDAEKDIQKMLERDLNTQIDRVENFTFKSLSVGMSILCAVREINDLDVVFSLPNNLKGFLNITHISDTLTKALEKEVAKKEGENSENLPDLSRMFYIGQLLPCLIHQLDSNEGGNRIELSLKSSEVNEGLSFESLYEGMNIIAEVKSKEDHGYVLSLGLPNCSGFLLNKNADSFLKQWKFSEEEEPTLCIGQPILCHIDSINKNSRTVNVTIDRDKVSTAVTAPNNVLTIETLRTGMLVNARVKRLLKNGLMLNFLEYFTGTVDSFHLNKGADVNIEEEYRVGQKAKARILFIDHKEKKIGLTMKPHLISLRSFEFGGLKIGDILDECIVKRIDNSVGLLLELPTNPPLLSFVHISHSSDKHVDKLDKKFKMEGKYKSRVIGFNYIDGLVNATMKQSILSQPLMTILDVIPGMLVEGTIHSVFKENIMVSLTDTIKGRCPSLHFADVAIQNPLVKFKAGQKFKCRVLSVDVKRKQILLTHKRTLINSDLPKLVSYSDATENLITLGYITKIENYGCIVSFYNGVHGLVPTSELGVENTTQSPQELFQLGQVVKCRVVACDVENEKLKLSFKLTPEKISEEDKKKQERLVSIKSGEILKGTVTEVSETEITLQTSDGLIGVLAIEHLSDHPSHYEKLRKKYSVGAEVNELLVIEKDMKKKILRFSVKSSLLAAVKQHQLPSTIQELQKGSIVHGWISKVTSFGCFVSFLGGLRGLAHKANLSDTFILDPEDNFSVGQSVRAYVLDIDADQKISLSLKHSLTYSTDASLLLSYFDEEMNIAAINRKGEQIDLKKYAIGSIIEATVQRIKEFGVILSVGDNAAITGFAIASQIRGTPCEVGSKVKARILDVDSEKGIIDLSIRADHIAAASSGEKFSKQWKENIEKLRVSMVTNATLELIKENYLVLSLPEYGMIGYAPTRDFNETHNPFSTFKLGAKCKVTVAHVPTDTDHRLLLTTSFTQQKKAVYYNLHEGINSTDELKDGMPVKCKVLAIHESQMNVALGTHINGRIHITEVIDSPEDSHPFAKYKVGDVLEAKVLSIHEIASNKFLPVTHVNPVTRRIIELTLKPSVLSLPGYDLGPPRYTLQRLKKGQIVEGIIHRVTIDALWVYLSNTVRGRVFVLDATDDIHELTLFQEKFRPGQWVKCRVLNVDVESQKLDLSIRAAMKQGKELVASAETGNFARGQVVVGRVAKKIPGQGLNIQLAGHTYGRAFITDLSDVYHANPLSKFEELQFVKCYILNVNKQKNQIDLSLRNSRVENNGELPEGKNVQKEVNAVTDLSVGEIVKGYVDKVVDKAGCFVNLSRNIKARVKFSQLSDFFIRDVSAAFPPGKLVTGKVLSIDADAEKVEMTLKTSSAKKKLLYEDVNVGDKLKGTIKRVEDFGVFVAINSSNNLVGLCHISEASDEPVKDLRKLYKEGEAVKVLVVRKNVEKKHISLSLKASHFENDPPSDDEQPTNYEEDADMEEQEEEKEKVDTTPDVLLSDDIDTKSKDKSESKKRKKSVDHSDDTDDVTSPKKKKDDKRKDDKKGTPSKEEKKEDRKTTPSKEEKDKKEKKKNKVKDIPDEDEVDAMNVENGEVDDEESEDDDENGDEDSMQISPKKRKSGDEKMAGISGGFDWDDSASKGKKSAAEEVNEAEEDNEEESLTTEKKKSKKAKKSEKNRKEKEIMEQEKLMLENKPPETAAEFDRLLLASPNNSFLWIKYMAFHISLAEIDAARNVAQKALNTINLREEKEKMNIWVAWMNLENKYGTQDSLLKVFNQALTYNEPKVVYMKLVDIYEASGNTEQAYQLYQTMCRKFKDSAKIWKKYAMFLLSSGKIDKFRSMIPECLKSLPKRKQVPMISKFAQLEFKHGFPERGRTLFEGILSNYPKRVDIWNIYVDMEMKVGDTEILRHLFERIVSLRLSAKKMKYFFTRWLKFESGIENNEEKIQYVKQRATEYIQSKIQ